MKIGLFPGQGVPAASVLEGLPPDDPYTRRAADVLGYDLRRKVRSAADTRGASLPTWLAQPAIFVAGAIAHREAVRSGETLDMLAGHSLGEYTALAAGGAMTFEQGLKLVEVRGLAMQRAAQLHPGGMVAVISLEERTVREIADASGAAIANHNSPQQWVLSGSDAALGLASQMTRDAGGRAVLLGVTGPFHTPAMRPATAALRHALDYTRFRSPRIPVISNVTARPYRAPGEIRKLLVEQLTSPVLFRQSLAWAHKQGVHDFTDLGPASVVAGLAQKTFAAMQEGVTADV